MKTFTLEWNAVMTLEDEGRPGRDALLELISLHGKAIDVGIVTTAASENTRLREMPKSASDFDRRLEDNGLGDLSRVPTVLVWGLSFIGYARFASPAAKTVLREIWEILPGAVPMDHLKFAEENGIAVDVPISSDAFWRWRNQFCDAYSLEAHIAAGRDVFVSGDVKNFKGSRRSRLLALGAREVCSYEDALEIARRK